MKICKNELMELIDATGAKSAWAKGVKHYAAMIVDNVDDANYLKLYHYGAVTEHLLNGAGAWRQYSYGGFAFIYDRDICVALCTESEKIRTKYGEKQPNSRESWLDVQARALFQASQLIVRVLGNQYGKIDLSIESL